MCHNEDLSSLGHFPPAVLLDILILASQGRLIIITVLRVADLVLSLILSVVSGIADLALLAKLVFDNLSFIATSARTQPTVCSNGQHVAKPSCQLLLQAYLCAVCSTPFTLCRCLYHRSLVVKRIGALLCLHPTKSQSCERCELMPPRPFLTTCCSLLAQPMSDKQDSVNVKLHWRGPCCSANRFSRAQRYDRTSADLAGNVCDERPARPVQAGRAESQRHACREAADSCYRCPRIGLAPCIRLAGCPKIVDARAAALLSDNKQAGGTHF